jgi:16S rRNA (uracil1498-N3)-methyltransferase
VKQFLLPRGVLNDGTVLLDGKDFRYLARGRRVKTGDTLRAALPGGDHVLMTVLEVGRETLRAAVHPFVEDGATTGTVPSIVLLQAMPKPAKMDLIIRQAAEAGVDEIVPFLSERSGRVSGDGASRLERWRRIVREARQQSGSPVETRIAEPCGGLTALFADCAEKQGAAARSAADTAGGPAAFVMCERPLPERGADGVQRGFHGGLSPRPALVFIAVGPEGGFSNEEIRLFLDNGFRDVTMGLRGTVLRVETAAAWAVAAVSVILGEKESWKLKE